MKKPNVYALQPFDPEETKALEQPDPQPVYAELIARCPVHTGPGGTKTLMRMRDIVGVNKRPDVLGPGAHGPTMGGQRPLPPLDLDGPEHARYRRLLDPLFSAKRCAAFEPQVRALASELIDGFISRGAADLRAEFCQPLPSRFFLALMGLPRAQLPEFLQIKDAILGHLPPGMTFPERMAAVKAASARCYQLIGAALDARTGPADDLLGSLAAAGLSRDEILDISFLMVLAGLDTTAAALTCIVARLARDPVLRARIVAEPSLWPTAIEELLRLESPVQHGFRTPSADVTVAGETLPAGDTFFLSWAGANLDPDVFVNPLQTDPARDPNPHIAWGVGFHRCLGIHLARLELRVALEELHRRIPDYELAPGHELVFAGKPRTANSLPLVWKASPSPQTF